LKSKTIFLIDSLGAISTTVLLIVVLKPFINLFGMPEKALIVLAVLASLLATYSLICYLFYNYNSPNHLRFIIIANLSYCIFTLGFIVYYFNELTFWGLSYFSGEILVIIALVYIEIKLLKRY